MAAQRHDLFTPASDLGSAYPVTLLPIRLETRFSSRLAEGASPGTAATRTLLVRIYPDDLTVAPRSRWPLDSEATAVIGSGKRGAKACLVGKRSWS